MLLRRLLGAMKERVGKADGIMGTVNIISCQGNACLDQVPSNASYYFSNRNEIWKHPFDA